jgi:hypothetical protein
MNAAAVDSGSAQTTVYGGLIDAIGGIAAGVLAILGLTGFDPEGMAGIATIVVGAAFLIQAAASLSQYAHMLYQSGGNSAPEQFVGGDGLTSMFLAGAGGIILGVLALLGMASETLTAIAVIAYGSALVLGSASMRQLYVLGGGASLSARSGHEWLAGQMISGSAAIQLLSGLAAVVLGILAVAGHTPLVLPLAALLLLGVTVLLTGTALSSLVLGFVRPAQGLQSTTGRTA